MPRILLLVLIMMLAGVFSYAEEKKGAGDDFISSTVSDVFDKVNKYTSGQKDLFATPDEDTGAGSGDAMGFTRDSLGRKVPRSTLKSGTASPVEEPL
ncbi:MAG: hypothetical protein PHP46_05625 [Candidatus Omnitrophica bacterium]|nr:hypothetical protein [Candidatus Omnitrophota bacterium]